MYVLHEGTQVCSSSTQARVLDSVDHENIVRFYAAVVQGPDSYLVMGKNHNTQLKLTAAYCMFRKLSNDLRLVCDATGSEIESLNTVLCTLEVLLSCPSCSLIIGRVWTLFLLYRFIGLCLLHSCAGLFRMLLISSQVVRKF